MVPEHVALYHITHVENLPSILERGGLYCKTRMQEWGIEHTSIAYNTIQETREVYSVPCGPGGTIHDYVPFYFAPRSPMLSAIDKHNVPNCPEGQGPVIYLVTSVLRIQKTDLPFVFTDAHATRHSLQPARFFADLADLREIHWDVMDLRYYWGDHEHPEWKHWRQAEFMIYNYVPWEAITQVGVWNAEVKAKVWAYIRERQGHPTPRVGIKNEWYF